MTDVILLFGQGTNLHELVLKLTSLDRYIEDRRRRRVADQMQVRCVSVTAVQGPVEASTKANELANVLLLHRSGFNKVPYGPQLVPIFW